tara:strand:+ start:218 stop:382 length:165 start_codon:yes stop_codon:yes gene_type:complete
MTVGVENSHKEHDKIVAQRAKSQLGKAFQGLFHAKRHSSLRQRVHSAVPKKNKK